MKFVAGPDQVYFLFYFPFSYLNSKKVDIRGKVQFGTTNPEIVNVRRLQVREVNYHILFLCEPIGTREMFHAFLLLDIS
jgi:hypothetical protein